MNNPGLRAHQVRNYSYVMQGVHALAEFVHQNCVLGRCANLCFIVLLQYVCH